MGLKPGDVVVHRHIANMVINTDLKSMLVVEYAAKHFKVDHIVVCGHYACGGGKAAMRSADFSLLNVGLRCICDVYLLHKDELNTFTDEELNHDRLVELNAPE